MTPIQDDAGDQGSTPPAQHHQNLDEGVVKGEADAAVDAEKGTGRRARCCPAARSVESRASSG